ncbi:alanine racemase [Agrococcus versicolor]|uniref:Alanine racemase n=1 Tax=Agrococcus versicolor TaxID=501482 RepID=A0ABN3AVR6_9MICO
MPTSTSLATPELRVDLDALGANVRAFRRRSRGLVAVVKADAFGHGDVVAHLLAQGADWLGTTSLAEAVALRERTGARTLAWLASPTADFGPAVAAGVDVAVPSLAHLRAVVAAARATCVPARVHLHVDLGIARDGAPREAWRELVTFAGALVRIGLLEPAGVMGHLSHAAHPDDARNRTERMLFDNAVRTAVRRGFVPQVRHVAATAAALRDVGTEYELVRVGAGLYGIDPAGGDALAPVIGLAAPAVVVRDVGAGTGVGYDHAWVATRRTRLATIPVGYADGIPRVASGRAEVLVRGRRARIVGAVSMDQVIVDVGDAGVEAGEPVTIVGTEPQAPTLGEWADWSGTIAHDIVTHLGSRWQRTFTGGAACA